MAEIANLNNAIGEQQLNPADAIGMQSGSSS